MSIIGMNLFILRRRRSFCLILALFCSLFLEVTADSATINNRPIAVYLTWQQSPSTTITIQWISPLKEDGDRVSIRRNGSAQWDERSAEHSLMPQKMAYLIHRIEIIGLEPDSEYYFKLNGSQQQYKFRTMPAQLDGNVRFVVGGDIYHGSSAVVRETNRQAAKASPHFALLGGDIAYAASSHHKNSYEDGKRWLKFLSLWSETMVTAEGHMIPMVCAIGNHDVRGGFEQTPADAAFFYSLFAMPGSQGYNVLDFGKYMTIFILDSGHTHPVGGKQAAWLEQALKMRQQLTHKFALYHVPAYPSFRSLDTKMSPEIRQNWVPIFEKYQLTAAFEHHDHDYKRTYLLKGGRVDPSGVLYLGDGAWGVLSARSAKGFEKRHYLAKTIAARHFILVTINSQRRSFQAIDSKGRLIDYFELNAT